jgi:hypothetical protein
MDALKGAKPDILDVTITYHSYTGEVPTWEMGMLLEDLVALWLTSLLVPP